ncbi:MAG: homoserine dehydrogenase [Longimicrobiaceae bacterium]
MSTIASPLAGVGDSPQRASTIRSPVAVPRIARRPRVVRVALAGCGVVGGELVRLIAHGADEIRARHGLRFELASVLVKHAGRARPDELPRDLLTIDVADFLRADAHVWVEAIGGQEPALRIARTVLGAGRRLVTANKALLAEHGPELAALARRSGARLDFESAVAGGIPVIRALRDSLGMTGIESVRGVLNGTTNYVLSRLAEGWRYADALADAQAKGFAEASPARDLSGEDAADKLRILAWLAFGVEPAALVVRRRGIAPHPERLAVDAALLGGVPRLVAEAVDTGEGIAAAVEPVIVPSASDLGRARDEENAVVIESRWNGRVRLSGPGAGGAPTASALLGDMLRSAGRAARPRAISRVPVEDGREHRWVLSVLREPRGDGVLERALQRAGVATSDVVTQSDRRVAVTRPTPWRRIDLAARVLETAHLAPVVSRCEVRV